MRTTRRPSVAIVAAVAAAAVIPPVALAGGGEHGRGGGDDRGHHDGPSRGGAVQGPERIALPNGWQPEGIAAGDRGQLYIGSIPTGAIYRADARTGEGKVLVPGGEGRAAIGLKVAGKRLVAAGGTTGKAFVYDARTGGDVAQVTLTTGNAFVNDVAIAGGSAYFTDSRQAQLYRLDLDVRSSGDRGGKGKGAKGHGPHGRGGDDDARAARLGRGGRHGGKHGSGSVATSAVTVPITGSLAYDDDPATNEANGIVALPGGKEFIVVQSRTGQLHRVNGTTGVSVEIPVEGGPLTNGDGLLLKGRTLYVVQNRLNQIAVVDLDRNAAAGKIARTITSPLFRVPTTLAKQRGALFTVNARFGTPAGPDVDYDVVRVPAK